jgi:hypothetical protein
VETHTEERRAGKSSFNFFSLLNLGLTGLTAFSNVPLRMWTLIGSAISLASILYASWELLHTLLLSNETSEAEKRKILQDDYDIQMTQTMEREVSVMCNLSKGVEEKGVAKGILSSIKNLMETMGLTIEQAMAALKVPEGERQKYMDLLERQ